MIGDFVARLRSRLQGGHAARELAAHWRAKYDALRTVLREREERERSERDALKAQSARRARRIPSVEVLQHMLQVRTPSARRRAAAVQSPGGAAPPPPSARRTEVDGLTWWVPVLPRQSAASVERMLAKQRFPYRAVSQTRTVAVGGIMLDIGANIGRMAIPRVILGDASRAYCAEPDPLNYQCLVANVVDNGLGGLVVPDHVAISDRAGQVPLKRGKMSGSHRVMHGGASDNDLSVPCTTLDAWVDQLGIDLADVTFVKVDTQGSEVHVLTGAPRVLAQPHIAWQIEIAPGHLRDAGSDARTLYALLEASFTHFFDLNPSADGPRLRPAGELNAALAYLEASGSAQTDIVLYRAAR